MTTPVVHETASLRHGLSPTQQDQLASFYWRTRPSKTPDPAAGIRRAARAAGDRAIGRCSAHGDRVYCGCQS